MLTAESFFMPNGLLLDGDGSRPLFNAALTTPMTLMPLAAAEIFSNPVALGYPGGVERVNPANATTLRSLPLVGVKAAYFEISGMIVGDAVSGANDVTLSLYRCPDGINPDPVALDTKTIAASGGTASGSELLTRGDFTAEATGTDGATTASNATVQLDIPSGLTTVAVGDYILIIGRTDGIEGGAYFEITGVNDGADTVAVTPTPSVTDTGLTWEIYGADWGNDWFRPDGWRLRTSQADYLGNPIGAKLQQDIDITAGLTYLLRATVVSMNALAAVDVLVGPDRVAMIRPAILDEPNDELRQLFFGQTTDAATPLAFKGVAPYLFSDLDNVSVKAVTPYYFSYVGAVLAPEADKGFGSFVRVGLLPAADFSSNTFASVSIRRWAG